MKILKISMSIFLALIIGILFLIPTKNSQASLARRPISIYNYFYFKPKELKPGYEQTRGLIKIPKISSISRNIIRR